MAEVFIISKRFFPSISVKKNGGHVFIQDPVLEDLVVLDQSKQLDNTHYKSTHI